MSQVLSDKPASPDVSKGIVDAIQSALSASISMGCSKRSVFHGLWIFLTTMLIENTEEPEDRIVILEGLCSDAVGLGFNSDSVLEVLDDATRQARVVDGRTVSQTLVACLDNYITEDPEGEKSKAVFECGMEVLLRSWGPVHFRRILAEQADAFSEGYDGPVFPVEPNRLNREKKIQAPSQVVIQEAEVVAIPAFRPRSERRLVDVCLDADVDDPHSVYAFVMDISATSGRRKETREISVRTEAENGRFPYLKGIRDMLFSLGEDRAVLRIETPAVLLVDGFSSDKSSRTVFPGESDIWMEIDALIALHDVEWVYLPNVLQTRLGERCDRILRLERERN